MPSDNCECLSGQYKYEYLVRVLVLVLVLVHCSLINPSESPFARRVLKEDLAKYLIVVTGGINNELINSCTSYEYMVFLNSDPIIINDNPMQISPAVLNENLSLHSAQHSSTLVLGVLTQSPSVQYSLSTRTRSTHSK